MLIDKPRNNGRSQEGGNITFIADALWSGGREFHYDDLNRLTQASGNFGPNLMEVIIFFAFFPASVVAAVLYGLVARIEPDL